MSSKPVVNGVEREWASLRPGEVFTQPGMYEIDPVSKLTTDRLKEFVVTPSMVERVTGRSGRDDR